MKLDLSKLPVLEAVVGFLLLTLIGTFVVAFSTIDPPRSPVEELATTPDEGSATPVPNGNGGGGAITVTMLDNSFDPDEITLAAGTSGTFTVVNEGMGIHNMRIAGEDNEYDTDDDVISDAETISAGEQGTLTWDAPAAPGEVDFRCDFHPTDMTGAITIE